MKDQFSVFKQNYRFNISIIRPGNGCYRPTEIAKLTMNHQHTVLRTAQILTRDETAKKCRRGNIVVY